MQFVLDFTHLDYIAHIGTTVVPGPPSEGSRSGSSTLELLGHMLASQTSVPHATDSQELSGQPLAKVSPSNGIQGQSHYTDSLAQTSLIGAVHMKVGTKASEDKYILLAISSGVGEWQKYPISDPGKLTSI